MVHSDPHPLLTGMSCGKVMLKLASGPEEVRACQKLRYEVFNEELGEGLPESVALGLDQDEFDPLCDHLMVIDSGRVVGTYRILPGTQIKKSFYSEGEFLLSSLWPYLNCKNEDIVELGRGCIHPEFRKQTTLMCLFWGLKHYVEWKKARYLLGCGSLPPHTSPHDAEKTFTSLLEEGFINLQSGVSPRPENQYSGQADLGVNKTPDLVRFYLKFGAQIHGRFAYDAVFKCYDALIVFDLMKISSWGSDIVSRFDERQRKNQS